MDQTGEIPGLSATVEEAPPAGMDVVSRRPWRTREWLEEGRRLREAWQKMERWGENSAGDPVGALRGLSEATQVSGTRDMPPRLSPSNILDCVATNSIAAGEVASTLRALPNLPHRQVSQLRMAVPLTTDMRWRRRALQTERKSMPFVLASCYILQVRQSGIPLDAVLMIHLVPSGARAKESRCHQAVHKESAGLTIPPEPDDRVAVAIQVWAPDSTDPRPVSGASSTQAAELASFVPALPFRDRPPLFGFQGQGELCRLGLHRKAPPFGATRPAAPRGAVASF